MYQQLKDQGLDLVTLNMEGEEVFDKAAKVLKDKNIVATNFCLSGGSSEEGLEVVQADGSLPAVNLYDRSGKLRYQTTGLDEQELDRFVRELLNEENTTANASGETRSSQNEASSTIPSEEK